MRKPWVSVNYNKEEDRIAYDDRFESEKVLIALSKTNRSIDSSDAQKIYKTVPEYYDTKIYLFVRKNKDDKEAKSFTFLGEITATGKPKEVEIPSSSNPNKKEKAFEIRYVLETPVDGATYDYLRGE